MGVLNNILVCGHFFFTWAKCVMAWQLCYVRTYVRTYVHTCRAWKSRAGGGRERSEYSRSTMSSMVWSISILYLLQEVATYCNGREEVWSKMEEDDPGWSIKHMSRG
jgi:hypothetical protein